MWRALVLGKPGGKSGSGSGGGSVGVFAIGRKAAVSGGCGTGGPRIGVRRRGKSKTQLQDDFARISRRTLNKRMGDFDGASQYGSSSRKQPKNGNKVLNRNNLLGDRPHGEAPYTSFMRINS